MTCFEMHISVNQRLQEVASFKRDKFLPQEIDLALNKAMFRILEEGVNSKFQDDQINLSHVTALLRKNRIEEVINPETTDPLYEDSVPSVYVVSPPDLYWLVNARVEVVVDALNCDVDPIVPPNSLLEFVSVVPFPAANASAPYFANVVISSTALGTLYTAPAAIAVGFNSSNSQYVVIQNILDTLYKHPSYPNLKVYWERYRDVYYKNSFIFVNNTLLGTVSISGTGLTTSSVNNTTTSYPGYNRAEVSATYSRTVQSTKNQEDDLLYSSLKQNHFYKTRAVEPVLNQLHDYLIVYREESFLVTRLYMDYIRKPRTISLLLNQSCELADSIHPKVIDYAVEILRLDIKDQSYPATVQDTELRTN